MNTLQAIVLAIIEGITEFYLFLLDIWLLLLPFLDYKWWLYTFIVIRAILSVVVLYFKRFFQTWDFYFKLFVAFIPAVVLGLLFRTW
jgi:undecaprenyl-diphosphatase